MVGKNAGNRGLNPWGPNWPWWALPAASILAWAGLFVHNLADLPGHSIASPESLLPLVVTLLLTALWFTRAKHVAAVGLLAWGLLNLLGGLISVLPLPFLPFVPEQTLSHYAAHGVYAAAQLPLLVAAARSARRPPARAA